MRADGNWNLFLHTADAFPTAREEIVAPYRCINSSRAVWCIMCWNALSRLNGPFLGNTRTHTQRSKRDGKQSLQTGACNTPTDTRQRSHVATREGERSRLCWRSILSLLSLACVGTMRCYVYPPPGVYYDDGTMHWHFSSTSPSRPPFSPATRKWVSVVKKIWMKQWNRGRLCVWDREKKASFLLHYYSAQEVQEYKWLRKAWQSPWLQLQARTSSPHKVIATGTTN